MTQLVIPVTQQQVGYIVYSYNHKGVTMTCAAVKAAGARVGATRCPKLSSATVQQPECVPPSARTRHRAYKTSHRQHVPTRTDASTCTVTVYNKHNRQNNKPTVLGVRVLIILTAEYLHPVPVIMSVLLYLSEINWYPFPSQNVPKPTN